MDTKDIARILESSTQQLVERDQFASPEGVLKELFDLVNSRLSVNLAVLEVVHYGVMIVSAESKNYSLPKPWTEKGLGVRAQTMVQRSLAPAMAYQGHLDIFTDPSSYNHRNRPEHVFDVILCPREVIQANTRDV